MLPPTKILITWMLVLLFIPLIFPIKARAKELLPGLQKVTLPNGLTAIVQESHRAPVVAVQVWVKAGSAYETDKEAGLTHVIEHMIFKGTETRGPGAIAAAIESVGGSINAYTSLDYTVYHCTVPKEYLDTALDVLSDAVFHSKFDEQELDREKKVVLEELRMREDQPMSRLSTLLMSTAYASYPYRRPIIGYPETIESFTRKDILAYTGRRYRPAQMSVVVVGDVDRTAALDKVKETFGAAPSEPVQESTRPTEPTQDSPRVAMESMDIQEGYLAVAFSGLPNFKSPEAATLDVLGAILGKGNSSRLVQALKNRLQLVHRIDAMAFTPEGPGLFEVTASLDPDKARDALGQILREVYRIQIEPVTTDELQRAKTQIVTDFVYSQETMQGEAQKLGVFQTLSGDPADEQGYIDRVQAVTAGDVMEAAKEIFGENNINVAMVMPKDRTVQLSVQDLAIMAQEADLQAKGLESLNTTAEVHPVQRFNLTDGLTVLVQEAPEVPTVSIQLVFPGGVRYETEDTNGLFNFLAQAWTKGTKAHSATQLSDLIEGMGGGIKGFSGQNTFGLQGRFLSQRINDGLGLFTEILTSATFPSDEVEKLRPVVVAQIKSQDDYLPGLAIREFRRLLFSPHPYGMDPFGRVGVVEKISSDQLQTTLHKFAVPQRGVMAIVGDVHAGEVIPRLEDLLRGWTPAPDNILPTPPAPAPLDAPKFLTLDRDKQQDHIVLGFPGTTFDSPDRFPLEVLSAVLSGQGGRLFTDLRDKESLAYTVTSFTGFGLDYGSFAFYIACAPDKKDAAIKGLWREIYQVTQEPISDAELDRAKKWLIGSYEIGLQTHGAKALDMALNELYGLGFNFGTRYVEEINKVQAQQVNELAKRILDPQRYILVQVGP